jgi:hypothetical protein
MAEQDIERREINREDAAEKLDFQITRNGRRAVKSNSIQV